MESCQGRLVIAVGDLNLISGELASKIGYCFLVTVNQYMVRLISGPLQYGAPVAAVAGRQVQISLSRVRGEYIQNRLT